MTLTEIRAMGRDEMRDALAARILGRYEEKERAVGAERMLFHQRMIMLQIVDTQWKDHLYSLDHLKEGIGLRGYGQRDPLVEYKKESFQMYQALMDRTDEEILKWIFLYQPVAPAGPEGPTEDEPGAPTPERPSRGPAAPSPSRIREPELAMAGSRATPRNLSFNDPSATPSAFAKAAQPREAEGGSDDVQTFKREGKKVGRNDPCPCGSGKKYKKCHGSA